MVNLSDKKILVIGAHADDIEYSVGGLILYSNDVTGLIVTDNKDRKHEVLQSSSILGYDPIFLDLEETNVDLNSLICLVEQYIKNIKPDIILTHYTDDTHQDHRATSQAVISACRDYKGLIAFFYSPSTINFLPNIFVGLTDGDFQIKLDAIKCHKSQLDKPFLNDNSIESVFKYWGTTFRQNGKYHEPLKLYRAAL